MPPAPNHLPREVLRAVRSWAAAVVIGLAAWELPATASPLQAPGPGGESLSLQQVLAEGLAVSARLQRADRTVARDGALTSLQRSLLLPRLDLIGSASFTQVGTSFGLVTGLPTLGDISLSLRKDGYAVLRNSFANAGVVLEMNLLPIQTLTQLGASRARQQGSQASLEETRRQVRFELVSTYRQLQLSQALLSTWRSALAASSALERDVAAFRRAGLAARIDSLRAEALTAADRQGLAEVEAQLASQQGRLAVLLQRPVESLLVAGEPIQEQPPWTADLNTTVSMALEQRPLLAALRYQQLAQRRQARAARASRYPSLGLVGGIGYSGDRLEVPVLRQGAQLNGPVTLPLPQLEGNGSGSGSFYNWGAALLLRQPLVDGGRSGNEAAVAEREVEVLEADEALARQQIRQEVTAAWQALQASPQAVAAARLGVAAQERALRDAQLRYRAQVDPLIDVLMVQRDLQAARAALLTVLTRQALDRAVLERETGVDAGAAGG